MQQPDLVYPVALVIMSDKRDPGFLRGPYLPFAVVPIALDEETAMALGSIYLAQSGTDHAMQIIYADQSINLMAFVMSDQYDLNILLKALGADARSRRLDVFGVIPVDDAEVCDRMLTLLRPLARQAGVAEEAMGAMFDAIWAQVRRHRAYKALTRPEVTHQYE